MRIRFLHEFLFLPNFVPLWEIQDLRQSEVNETTGSVSFSRVCGIAFSFFVSFCPGTESVLTLCSPRHRASSVLHAVL